MRKLIFMLLGTFLISGHAFAQEGEKEVNPTEDASALPAEDEVLVNHTVAMGETIALISKKYLVSPQDIYAYNEKAIEGVSYNMVLQIPMHKSAKSKKADQNSKARKDTTLAAPAKDSPTRSVGKLR